MDRDEIPEIFWDALNALSFEGLPEMPGSDDSAGDDDWTPPLPDGLTDELLVADPTVSFGRMVHLVGDPASPTVAYTHVILRQGLLGMRVYFPAQAVPGTIGIPAFLVGFRDMPQVRRMYDVQRVLERLHGASDERLAYGRAVSSATVQQAIRALAGLAALERMPFALLPLYGA
ncbi:MAG TPA: hypothetical protein VFB58_05145 [Chloroflexota bacterium]|nr:hypothetical protein [Chloroflexota bacterium]